MIIWREVAWWQKFPTPNGEGGGVLKMSRIVGRSRTLILTYDMILVLDWPCLTLKLIFSFILLHIKKIFWKYNPYYSKIIQPDIDTFDFQARTFCIEGKNLEIRMHNICTTISIQIPKISYNSP